eukprot:TRINITY_DN2224_c0_g1_i1.p1 TRINITY_DN2224_c0_g1~~TRINITY_DN2224_c0_g1_i1.p1  ORF type:complete len:1448 (-),score=374.15 TRINITY_DN2224_c0_g1_i1:403-4746(-)
MATIEAEKGRLFLADGSSFEGYSFGAKRAVAGELVFNTGMVGYPEALTDPSYRGQILVLTFPLIGNYGVPSDDTDEFGLKKFFESEEIHITGLIVSDYSSEHSHWNSKRSLSEWLVQHNIPALYGIDTRLLTKKIRLEGAILSKLIVGAGDDAIGFEDPNKRNLVAEVSVKEPKVLGSGDIKILAVDCGMKYNIIRCFLQRGVQLKIVPWDYDFNKDTDWDGLFISNGPGDPMMAWKTVTNLKVALEGDKPIFGICLGNQLLSLATGAKTYKMKFGNRGMNQPCIDLLTQNCYITPQNHGFAVDTASLREGWRPYFTNANDGSNEGIYHIKKPFFSVQFHPEAKGGPTDTDFLFEKFLANVRAHKAEALASFTPTEIPKTAERISVRRVLVLGSGGLSIGQAGEFDYSGSQCIKALKEEGIYTILVNPNIATIQTSKGLADRVYFIPVKPEFVTDVIKRERPDGIILSCGGQTALNCGIELDQSGVLREHGVRVLGTPVSTIIATEDREIFSQKLAEIGVRVAPSASATTIEGAKQVAAQIGYPVILRAAFALGGLGSGFADNEEELVKLAEKALASSEQVLIDKSLKGWKEIEYEVVRDCMNNCITVCNMENFDPLGIHTGDSIVIAPSQTLSNEEYYMLRTLAIKVIRHLGVVGECNIQYALDPLSEEVFVIEVNARLSRSSALASKATGYPLAFVAAKLSLNMTLPEIKNSMTRVTTACFEPSLDYCVVKIPRWDLNKFHNANTLLGSAMKSVGEVMSIGRKFEEAFQKAIRMVDPSAMGFEDKGMTFEDLDHMLENATPARIFALAFAFKKGYTVDRIYELTKIDRWFLFKCKNVVDQESQLASFKLSELPKSVFLRSKQLGFADIKIGKLCGASESEVRAARLSLGIRPSVKQIDTLAAEFPAKSNYLYVTYNGSEDDITFNDNGVIVLGSGCYRIGSSVEFDWCGVSCVRTLRSLGYKTIMINYNPETVSTDYDEADRLYFEELSLERVLDVYQIESSSGVIVSVGGQTPNNIVMDLSRNKVKILGTAPENIDQAEDRSKFSNILDRIKVDQPDWSSLTSADEAEAFADRVGYPILVRPSYVLSGAAMNVAYSREDLHGFLAQAADVSPLHPVVISKFIEEAKEIEMDAVARDGDVLVYAISEHVENAGVHSGDATLVLPAQNLYVETMRRVKSTTKKIAKALNISGPFNIQYLAKNNDLKVIECNVRASRTFPFVSKTFNIDFINIATKVMMGIPVAPVNKFVLELDYVAIKAPQFSFTRLHGADPVLGVEMASTGEVACFGEDKHEAFLRALLATGFKLPKKTILLSTGPSKSKLAYLDSAHDLHRLGYELLATPGTAKFLSENGIPVTTVYWPLDRKEPNIQDLLTAKKIDMVINIPKNNERVELTNGYMIRRMAADYGISLITNINCAKLFVEALVKDREKPSQIKSWDEYLRMTSS